MSCDILDDDSLSTLAAISFCNQINPKSQHERFIVNCNLTIQNSSKWFYMTVTPYLFFSVAIDRIITILPGAVEGEMDLFFTAGAGERKQ